MVAFTHIMFKSGSSTEIPSEAASNKLSKKLNSLGTGTLGIALRLIKETLNIFFIPAPPDVQYSDKYPDKSALICIQKWDLQDPNLVRLK
jgi:hypothetical protein